MQNVMNVLEYIYISTVFSRKVFFLFTLDGSCKDYKNWNELTRCVCIPLNVLLFLEISLNENYVLFVSYLYYKYVFAIRKLVDILFSRSVPYEIWYLVCLSVFTLLHNNKLLEQSWHTKTPNKAFLLFVCLHTLPRV